MKTMLGGWEDVHRSLGVEAAERTASIAAAPISVRRCVAVTPRDSARASALWQSHGPRKTCLGGTEVPSRAVSPGSEPPRSRPSARKQPPPLPAHLRPRGPAPASASFREEPQPMPRLPLDATCELSDLELIVMPVPPAAAAPAAPWGTRRGGTLLEPYTPGSSNSWWRRLRGWAKRRFGGASVASHK